MEKSSIACLDKFYDPKKLNIYQIERHLYFAKLKIKLHVIKMFDENNFFFINLRGFGENWGENSSIKCLPGVQLAYFWWWTYFRDSYFMANKTKMLDR